MHRVAVVGATGFAGALCAWIVQRHPRLELAAAMDDQANRRVLEHGGAEEGRMPRGDERVGTGETGAKLGRIDALSALLP